METKKENTNQENAIDYDRIAVEVAKLLANCEEGPKEPGRKPSIPPKGKIVHLDPAAKHKRVWFAEEGFDESLASNGLMPAARQMRNSPAEVKLILALLLGVKVGFSDVEHVFCTAPCGFDNPLVADSRVGLLADHFGVSRERLELEISNAPLEMVAVLLKTVDLCLGGVPVAQASVLEKDDKEVC